ncbi:hypothetical protein LINGRAHAP2_LOCUS21339 [Linum grandiflorum]
MSATFCDLFDLGLLAFTVLFCSVFFSEFRWLKPDRKEKKPSLNDGTVAEFLGSCKQKPVTVDDPVNFNSDEAIPKGNAKTFNLENLGVTSRGIFIWYLRW